MSLADLPVELFEWILDYVCFSDYKSLRLVGLSKFNKCLIPRLFKHYYINFHIDSLANLSQASQIQPIAASIRTISLDTTFFVPSTLTRKEYESHLDLRPRFTTWFREQNPSLARYFDVIKNEYISRSDPRWMNSDEVRRMRMELEQAYNRLDRKGGLSAKELAAGFAALRRYWRSQLKWQDKHDRELQQALARLPNLSSFSADSFILGNTPWQPPPMWRRVVRKTYLGPRPRSSQFNIYHHEDRALETRSVASLVRALDYRASKSGNKPLRELKLEIPYGWNLFETESKASIDRFQSFAHLERLVLDCRWLDGEDWMDAFDPQPISHLRDKQADLMTEIGQMMTAAKALMDLRLAVRSDIDSLFRACDFLSWIMPPQLSTVKKLELALPIKASTLLKCLATSSIKSLRLVDCLLIIDDNVQSSGCNTWREVINKLHEVVSLESYYFETLYDAESNLTQYSGTWFDYGLDESIEEDSPNYSAEYCAAIRDAIMNGVPLQSLDEPLERLEDLQVEEE